MSLSEHAYNELLERIDSEPAGSMNDQMIEPIGNDDGRARAAISALLTCSDADLISARLQLQRAYCEFFDISEVDDAQDSFEALRDAHDDMRRRAA